MTYEQIFRIAMEQSDDDMNCKYSDFLAKENIVVPFKLDNTARKYLKELISCDMVSYGNNIVVSVTEEIREVVSEFIEKFTYYCFETPNMHWLNDRLLRNDIRFALCPNIFCRM